MPSLNNPNRNAILFSAVLLVLALTATLLGLSLFDGDLGYWTASLGGVTLVIALVMLPVFVWDGRNKARAIASLVKGAGLLAHWQYHPDELNRFARQERARALASARKTSLLAFPVVLGMCLIGGLLRDVGLDATYLMVAVLIGLGISAFLAGLLFAGALLGFRRNQTQAGEAYISESGVYFDGQYYSWSGPGVSLTAVEFLPGEPAVIAFRYEASAGGSVQSHAARVPVPQGHEEAAQAVVSRFYSGR